MRLFSICLVLCLLGIACQTETDTAPRWRHSTLTNQISFTEKNFENFAAAFLVESDQAQYAVTSKQFIQAFSSLGIMTVDFKDLLNHWILTEVGNGEQSLKLGRLINRNATEQAALPNLVNDRDFLVFEVPQKNPNLVPFKLEVGPLNNGDQLFTQVWFGEPKKGEVQTLPLIVVSLFGNQVFMEASEAIEDPVNMIGAPIFTSDERLIGIISTVDGQRVRGCSINYLLAVLRKYERLQAEKS